MSFARTIAASLVLLGTSLALPSHAAGGDAPGPTYARIAKDIQAEIAAGRLTGVSVALVQHGHVVWEQGFGWADREAGRKATAHTPFSIASTSKTFTTAAIMTLVKAGKIRLDAPANDYLGKYKIVDDQGPTSAATVRMLASHKSGLPSFFLMYTRGAKVQRPTTDALLRDYGHLVARPGTHYEYSNLGYQVLDDIVQRTAHDDFGAYLQKHIFQPLGMKDSFFETDAKPRPSRAVRYDDDGHAMAFYVTATPGSGGVYASAYDLARWAMFNLKDHRVDQAPILSDDELDQLHEPQSSIWAEQYYALGWDVWKRPDGTRVVGNPGGQSGVRSEFVLVPSADVGCVVLSNSRADREFIDKVRDRLVASLVPGWPGLSFGTPKPVPLHSAGEYAGAWKGVLTAQGKAIPVALRIWPDGKATFAVGQAPAAGVDGLGRVDKRLVGDTTGVIEAPDAEREHLQKLSLDVRRDGDRLLGEAVAWRVTADRMAIVPYHMELKRLAQ
ncbi:serine hydrolase domain-containing protein [Frateuria terrea]|uniref:CubicO group peptidase, beta-lactamase class C family n=1 Tax=Frateuria terrea TaxID=529704 RepID=A0A1H6ZD36_9GAMM|nr:serine hydrolase domain-containing protein [Frateuria terrea]SEJ51349.1 CubicO group peptidase, beta-lactamase class C family [Frateuria terrea]SFP79386.1 CubicO group peptidase, beta-lactamase class C family [Frateuria terrea]